MHRYDSKLFSNDEATQILVAEDPAASLPLSAPLRATSGNVTFDMIPNKSALMVNFISLSVMDLICGFEEIVNIYCILKVRIGIIIDATLNH